MLRQILSHLECAFAQFYDAMLRLVLRKRACHGDHRQGSAIASVIVNDDTHNDIIVNAMQHMARR